jgi:hypothetical protein
MIEDYRNFKASDYYNQDSIAVSIFDSVIRVLRTETFINCSKKIALNSNEKISGIHFDIAEYSSPMMRANSAAYAGRMFGSLIYFHEKWENVTAGTKFLEGFAKAFGMNSPVGPGFDSRFNSSLFNINRLGRSILMISNLNFDFGQQFNKDLSVNDFFINEKKNM